VIDLHHCEAALKLFDPDVQISELGPRKVPQVLADVHGDTGRVILATLREPQCRSARPAFAKPA
jgi:hypothetical protein